MLEMNGKPEWVTLCKRTEDPKLRYLEYRLGCMGIEHRRNGRSFHAPILEVPKADEGDAWKLLDEKVGDRTLDDIRDDDPMFADWEAPEGEEAADEEAAWYDELNRGYDKDRMK